MLVPFLIEFAGPAIEKQEGNNSFKKENSYFEFKKKYCLDLCIWWTLTDKKNCQGMSPGVESSQLLEVMIYQLLPTV